MAMLRCGALVRACACHREMRRLQIFGACCVTRDVGSPGGSGSWAEEGRRWEEGTYALPFICAISDTSPTSKLNVTFLQTCAIEPQYERRSRGQRTVAYNCRSVGICAMLVGSVPVRRFSPNSLPGRHQRSGGGTEKDRAWVTYRLAMDGIEETKSGNRPVSAFRATFLRHHALRTPVAAQRAPWACTRACFAYYAAVTAGSDSLWSSPQGSTLPHGGRGHSRPDTLW